VDSLTTIITPRVVQATLESDARRERNRTKKQGEKKENLSEPFKDKALSMRLLQDAVTMWGTDVLWIYHLQDSRDEKAEKVTRATLSATERARLYRSINLELHVVQEGNRRGVKVVWARRGRSGMTLWDDTGRWESMPEKIEQAVYGGLSVPEQEAIEKQAPSAFPTEEAAIDWGVGRGVFKGIEHARNTWEKIKRENPNLNLARWSTLWADEVEARAGHSGKEAAGDFANFCYQVMVEIGFFESDQEITTALTHLGMAYHPEQEEALMELLRLHVQALPSFATLDGLLFRLHEDFGLKEKEAKAKLKMLKFGSFPKEGNGEAKNRSRRMYWAVLVTTPKQVPIQKPAEEDIPF
jgi:hypothetical protein